MKRIQFLKNLSIAPLLSLFSLPSFGKTTQKSDGNQEVFALKTTLEIWSSKEIFEKFRFVRLGASTLFIGTKNEIKLKVLRDFDFLFNKQTSNSYFFVTFFDLISIMEPIFTSDLRYGNVPIYHTINGPGEEIRKELSRKLDLILSGKDPIPQEIRQLDSAEVSVGSINNSINSSFKKASESAAKRLNELVDKS